MIRLVAALVLVCGCGRFGFDSPFGDDDTSPDAASDATSDTASDACVLGPWSTAEVITTGFGFLASDPAERADRKELIFAGMPMGSYDLFVSTRASASDPYSTSTIVANINDVIAVEANPALTGDGLTLFFTSDRTGSQRAYFSTRATTSSAWSAPMLVPGLETEAFDSLTVTPNGLALYISHTNIDLRVARRASTSMPFSASVLVNDEPIPYPSISPDELDVYSGGVDHRHRSSIADPFGPSEHIEMGHFVGDPEVGPDGTYILVGGGATIEQSTRSCL